MNFTRQTPPETLPASVTVLSDPERTIYLIGTAHVSTESVNDVRTTITTVQPDTVCVELCPARLASMTNRDAWRKMDIFKVIKEKKALFLLAQLVLASFYRKIGEQLGVQPGAEMLEGVRLARETGAVLIPADRAVDVTLKRVWGGLGLWSRMKMLAQMLAGILGATDIDRESVENLKNHDQLEAVMGTLAQTFPEIKERLIDERDLYLSEKIRQSPGQAIVAVVGAGHVPGIVRNIGREIDLGPLTVVPKPSGWGTFWKWFIPTLIIGILVYGFATGGAAHSVGSISIWVLVNGSLSALGAALALAHPATIAATFVAAPLTSLNPMIAAGWVAGLVQAWVKKPTVADLEDIPNAIGTLRGFWGNPVCRILLVVVLANIGSSIGTFVSGSWIAARTF
ncbi:MAG: TraB/GumN family protein [Deltaproteobacteria bacterium]|nr:TraB/GumN family protein [Deltaproteobacteria bacterium]